MLKSQRMLIEIFDYILFCLWDVTTGASVNGSEAFKGATRYSRFLRSELKRREGLEEAGEAATFRRGKTIPNSLINAWAWNILEDCRDLKVPPPRALLDVIYWQLGCTHRTSPRAIANEETKRQAKKMIAERQSLRQVAKFFDVNPTTVMRWNETPQGFDQESLAELRQITNVERFYPPGFFTGRTVKIKR